MTGAGGAICVIPRWKGRGAVPWKAENEDTATSPKSGERGLLEGRLLLPWSDHSQRQSTFVSIEARATDQALIHSTLA